VDLFVENLLGLVMSLNDVTAETKHVQVRFHKVFVSIFRLWKKDFPQFFLTYTVVADRFRSSNAVCRAAAGPCDVAENCPGDGPDCPANAYEPPETVCRAANGGCDLPETCTGMLTFDCM
jgi:hypothetical protein